jgi:hypothetical protein
MTTPEEAARRILEPPKKERPTIAELEAILAAPDGPPITINPDGSIGVGESDATIVAHALLAAEARIRELENIVKHMLEAIDGGTIDSEEIAGDYESGISPHKWHDQWSYYARRALAKPEETP